MRMKWKQACNMPSSSIAAVNLALHNGSPVEPCVEPFHTALFHFAFQPSCDVISIITPILQMKKVGLKEANYLAQDPLWASLFS